MLSEHTLVEVAPMPNPVDILTPADSHEHLPALPGWRCTDALHITSEHGMSLLSLVDQGFVRFSIQGWKLLQPDVFCFC